MSERIMNGSFICRKHGISFRSECPSCKFEKELKEADRLEEIKKRFNAMNELENFKKLAPTELFFNDLDWLIEQAKRAEKNAQDLHDMDLQLASEQKRVKELEFENGRLARRLDWKEESNQERESNLEIIIELIKEDKNKIDQQNKRYRKALEFYAVSGQGIGEEKHGEVAREALESDEG